MDLLQRELTRAAREAAALNTSLVLADACACRQGPREFEQGRCHRCGRLISCVPEGGGAVDGWLLLEAAVERERLALRAEAHAAGVDPQEWAARALGRLAGV